MQAARHPEGDPTAERPPSRSPLKTRIGLIGSHALSPLKPSVPLTLLLRGPQAAGPEHSLRCPATYYIQWVRGKRYAACCVLAGEG